MYRLWQRIGRSVSFLLGQVHGVDEPAGSAVAVGERVYRLELVVACGHSDQRVDAAPVVHEAPQLVEHASDARLPGGRRVDDSARSGDDGPAFAADRHSVALRVRARSGGRCGSGRLARAPFVRVDDAAVVPQGFGGVGVGVVRPSQVADHLGHGGDDVLDGGARLRLDHRQDVQQRLAVAELRRGVAQCVQRGPRQLAAR